MESRASLVQIQQPKEVIPSVVTEENTASLTDDGIIIKVRKDREHLQTAMDFLQIYLNKFRHKAQSDKE